MSSAHAKFSPSGAHRWMECAGSLVLEQEFPNESSVYADEGTAAHTLAAGCLTQGSDTKDFIGMPMAIMDEAKGTVRNSFTVTDEFAMYVQVYLDDVRDRAKGRELFIEQRLELSKLLKMEDQFGTGDALIADVARRHLTVEDLKFGMGEKVYANGNHQMYLYALGALETLDLVYGSEAFDDITVVVCQPRLDWIDEFTITIAELRSFGERARKAAAVVGSLFRDYSPATLAGNWHAYLTPGDKTCRWCRAKATCPALAAKVSEEAFADFPAAIDEGLTPAMAPANQSAADDALIGKRYMAVDLVIMWAKAVAAEAERRVFAGAKVIGSDGLPLKIVTGKKGNRMFDKENIDTITGMLAAKLTPDKMYEPAELKSVAQIQAALGVKNSKVEAKKPENNPVWKPFLPYIKQAPGSPVIALGSDPRQETTSTAPEATDAEFDAVDPLTA